MKMIESTSPKTPQMEFFKKVKRLNFLELSPTILGCFFFTLCLIFCLFLLDYKVVNNENQVYSSTWFFGLNNGSTSLASLASLASLEKVSNNKRVNFIEEETEACDIFDGNWVWDESYPIYESKNCEFLDEGFRCSQNGRPDNFYTKWRWQPKACNLPRFNATDMLERLRNLRVVFVGDSIGRNQWESLLCMLSSAITNKSSIYEIHGYPITKHTGSLVYKFINFNCTIEYYRAPFLVLQSRAPSWAPPNVKLTLKLDQMDWSSTNWKDADILIFNSGHWWNYEKTIRVGCYFQEGTKIKKKLSVENAFRRSLVTLFHWISHEVNMTKSHVFFRSYAPVHFRGGDWRIGGSCHLETLPDLTSLQISSSSEKLNIANDVLSRYLEKLKLQKMSILNVTNMTSRRKDGHSSVYYLGPNVTAPLHKQDCSHWCLPGVPDVWNEILYAVYLKRQNNLVRIRE